MKEKSIFLAKFIILSSIGFFLWSQITEAFLSSVIFTAYIFIDLLRLVVPVSIATSPFPIAGGYSSIPLFVALILSTTIKKSRTVLFIAIGSVIIFLFQVIVTDIQLIFVGLQIEMVRFYAIGRIALPFLLWVGFTKGAIFMQKSKNNKKIKTHFKKDCFGERE